MSRWLIALFAIMGLAHFGDGDDDGNDGADGGDGDGSSDEGKTFTQDDMTRVASREAKKATKAEAARIAAELGVSPAKAAEILKAHKEADEKNQTESERAKAEADADRADAKADRKAAKQERLDAKVERKLAHAGMDDAAIGRFAPTMGLDPDADDDDIDQAIEKLEDDLPALFGEPTEPRKPASSSTPKRKREKKVPAATSLEAGKAAAKERFGTKEPVNS